MAGRSHTDGAAVSRAQPCAPSVAQIDQMVVTMAGLIEDGDFLAEGIGTFLPTAAYMLAKHTHAPHCTSLCPNGNTLMQGTRTLTLGHDEFETVPKASLWLDYVKINLVYMPTIFIGGRPRWTEFMRPAQIDPWGATNNVCIGAYARPRVRLPGSAGIPDASTVARRFYYYIPRHGREVLVPKLDFCSGAGNPRPGAAASPARAITVVTNLCVLASGPDGRLRGIALQPGVTREEVAAETAFELDWVDKPTVCRRPTGEQQRLLDGVVDPQGLRHLEALSGDARRIRLRELAAGSQESHL